MKGFVFYTVLWLTALWALGASRALGQEVSPPSSPGDAQFRLDDNLVETIYQETTETQGVSSRRATANLVVQASLAYLSPTELSLSNQYFEVGYDQFSGIPSFQIDLSSPLFVWKYAQISAVGRFGYGRKEALTEVRSASGGSFRDMVQLNWLPVGAGVRVHLIPGDDPKVRPFVEAAGGVQWLYQSGKLDKALEQGYWIPYWRASVGSVFFGSQTIGNDWFGGVVASVTWYRSFQSVQRMNGWSADLGLSILL